MKIVNTSKKISFAKKLVANCAIIKKEDTSYPCQIYSLDKNTDSDYFETVKNAEDWKNGRYLCYLKEDLKTIEDDEEYEIFALEDKNGDCLCYSETAKRASNVTEILFLETVPSQTFLNSHKSKFKYIGETLLSFMIKKAKTEKENRVELHPSILSTTFYKNKCFFIQPRNEVYPYYLNKNRFSKLIKQNERHTHSTIELIG